MFNMLFACKQQCKQNGYIYVAVLWFKLLAVNRLLVQETQNSADKNLHFTKKNTFPLLQL